MAELTYIEKMQIESALEMGDGWVLDFSNRTLSEFVRSVFGIEILDEKYNYASGSKANRIRAFLEKESDELVGRLLKSLLEYKITKREIDEKPLTPQEQATLKACQKIIYRLIPGEPTESEPPTEEEFLRKEFKDVSLDHLGLDSVITDVLKERLVEINHCLQVNAPLATIFLCGSTLEGILLGIASMRPNDFKQSPNAPKDKKGKVLPLDRWSLSQLIDVAHHLKLLGEDVMRFSHALRNFRNYIHPYAQVAAQFSPNKHTAEICWKVLQAAIYQLRQTISGNR